MKSPNKFFILLFIISTSVLGCSSTSQESIDRQKFNRLCEDIVLLADDAIFYRIQSGGEFYDRLDTIALNLNYLVPSIPEANELQKGLNSFSRIYQEQFGRNSAPTGQGIIPLDYLLTEYCGINYLGD